MKQLDSRALRNRVLTARGHMAAIVAMMDRGAPCAEILGQTRAVRGAMIALHRALWRAYLLDSHCGLRANNSTKRAQAWKELRPLLSVEREK